MQKETKIQGILMCLFYLGHLCLDLVHQRQHLNLHLAIGSSLLSLAGDCA